MIKYLQEKAMVNAAAALILYRNKFLLVKRSAGKYRDQWQFPQSSIEDNETAFEAVKREVISRLGVAIFPYQSIKRFTYQTTEKKGQLVLIRCSILSSPQSVSPDKTTYSESIWTNIVNAKNLDFAPVDKHIIAFLLRDDSVLPHKAPESGQTVMDSEKQRMKALRMKKRGFGSMSLTKRQAIAKMGGKAAHTQGKAHHFTSEEAKLAGRIGGRGKRRKYTQPTEPIDDKEIAKMYQQYSVEKIPVKDICREFHISRTMLYRYFAKYHKHA